MRPIWINEKKIEPLGHVCAARTEHGLLALSFPSTVDSFRTHLAKKYPDAEIHDSDDPLLEDLFQQIDQYVQAKRTKFDHAIDPDVVSGFQKMALDATSKVSYGTTVTYKQIAVMIGQPNAARAVGRAEATNPLPLVIPCHRVIGSDGNMHGYGAGKGIATKQWLLELEQRVLNNKG